MKTNLLLTLGLLASAVAGCAVGPDYHAPQASAPARWSEPLAGGEAALPADTTAWWRTFDDRVLDSLVARAGRSNPDVRIAQARVREARAHYRAASADLWPSADLNGGVARTGTSHRQPVLGSIPLPPGVPFENSVYQAGFDASWELDVFGGKRRAREAAEAEVGAVVADHDDTLTTLLGEVARNYVELRASQRRLAIARRNITVQRESLAITRDRYTNGLVSNLDALQAATVLANTEAETPALESAIQASMHRLGILLGGLPGSLSSELSAEAPIPVAASAVPVGLPSELLLRRPDVRRAERRLAAATAGIGVARSEWFPKFSLTGAAGFESVSSGDWFSPGSKFWSLGPTVQWRVFDAGRIRANVKVQTAREEQALAAYEQAVLTAFEDVENALVGYAKEQIRRGALLDALGSSRGSLDLARKLYDNGLTGFLAVLEAERSVYQAEDQVAQSDRAIASDRIVLYKALGGGWRGAELAVADSGR